MTGSDGHFSFGAGYHPSQPYEISYAFRAAVNGSESAHFLSFIWQFEGLGKKEGSGEVNPPTSSSSEINIGAISNLVETPSNVGKPVSGVPMRKMAISVEPSVFSPSGRQKTANISFPGDNSSNIARWLVSIQAPDQTVIRRFAGTGPLAPSFAWDGLNDSGKAMPEGKYRIALKTFGKKNELLSDDYETVEIISPRSHFELLTTNPYFSTRAKKGKGNISFTVNAGGSPDVQSWDFEISEASTNKVVYEKLGQNRLPHTLKWDGSNLDGDQAGDGAYLCLLTAQDKAGNPLKTDALQVFLNNTPPELNLKGQSQWADFSSGKSFHFNLEAADRVGISQWKMVLKDEDEKTIKNFDASGQPPADVAWDGKT
ncbi:MAG TPA: hypothetical protein VJ873_05890, partial [bacterium]|nr:hypothetical protein [bacterium]